MVDARSPKAYTGRVLSTSLRAGDCYFDSTDFSVASDGKVSLSATGALEGLAADSGTVTPAAGSLTLAGTTNLIETSGSGATITFDISEVALQYAAVTLTNAEIKGIRASQKTLVAAPGAGKVIVFEKALLKLNYGSNVLTESTDNMSIRYTNGAGVKVSVDIEAGSFIDASADTYTVAIPVINSAVAASASENKALVLDNDGDGEYGGNASNDTTMDVAVWYRVASI